jgi:uncharacterized protein YcfJ
MKMHHILQPAIAAGALAAALPAAAQMGYGYDGADVRYGYARVLKVDAIVNHASRPVSRETCWEEPTYRDRPSYTYYRDYDGDDLPDAVTIESSSRVVSGSQQHCRTETDWRTSDRVLGYEVTYRYGGREYTTRMDHDPGNRLRVRVNYDYSITPDE